MLHTKTQLLDALKQQVGSTLFYWCFFFFIFFFAFLCISNFILMLYMYDKRLLGALASCASSNGCSTCWSHVVVNKWHGRSFFWCGSNGEWKRIRGGRKHMKKCCGYGEVGDETQCETW